MNLVDNKEEARSLEDTVIIPLPVVKVPICIQCRTNTKTLTFAFGLDSVVEKFSVKEWPCGPGSSILP